MDPHHQLNAIMKTASSRVKINSQKNFRSTSAFTLVELLVASFVAALVSALTWNIMIDSYKGDLRTESRRRLHEEWNRARSLIQSEIALSDIIEHQNIALTEDEKQTEGCNLLKTANDGELKLRMFLLGTLPEIIYGVRKISSLPVEEARKWRGGPDSGILIRCGPRMLISENGKISYEHGKYQQSIVLDNIDLSNGGLTVNPATSSEKLVEFSLSMNENIDNQNAHTLRSKTLKSSGMSRINEVPPIPSDISVCERICSTKDYYCGNEVITLLKFDARSGTNYPANKKDQIVTSTNYEAKYRLGSVFGTESVCTNRPFIKGATLAGNNGNYVIDGNPTPERSNS